MESPVQRRFAAAVFARKRLKRSYLAVLSTRGADEAKFHVKEYQDVAKSISEDFFNSSKQIEH